MRPVRRAFTAPPGPRGVTGTADNRVWAYGEIEWGGTTCWITSGRQGR